MAEIIKEDFNILQIPLNGRWRPAVDGTQMGNGDFQTLTNMRYGELSPKSVTGMTKINTSVINATNLKPRRMFNFTKTYPENASVLSYTLVQAWNSGLTGSAVYYNTTTPPTAGNFVTDNIWSDTAGCYTASMSKAPDESMVYCNGKDTCVYSGSYYRTAGFFVGALDGTVMYDYTKVINNVLSDSSNVATLSSVTTTAPASDTTIMALWHMNNALTSDSGTAHNLTASGDAGFDTTYKFGTHSAKFDGTGDYFTTSDHAEFTFTTFTIDCWIYIDSGATGVDTIISHKKASDEFYYFWVQKGTSKWRLGFTLTNVGPDVDGVLSGYVMDHSTWYHVQIASDATNFYLFINGSLVSSITPSGTMQNYTDDLYIGADNHTGSPLLTFKGYIDELRISNVCRNTTNFDPPTRAYGSETNCYVYIASTRPIYGAYFTIATANASASSVTASYWANGAWTTVGSLVDGTVSTTKTLATSGAITFTSTVSTAKPVMRNDTYAYWYLFTFTNIDATTKVSNVKLLTDFQRIVDLWDGEYRPIASFQKYTTKYIDVTTNVLNEDFVAPGGSDDDTVATGTLTFANLGSLSTSQYVVAGFVERMTGLRVKMVQAGYAGTAVDRVNTNVCSMTISYWDGDEWIPCTGVEDGTSTGGASLGRSGVVTWDSPSEISEQKFSVQKNVDHYYYYKITFDANLSVNTFVDHITGISAQKTIRGYRFPVMWQSRCVLLNEWSTSVNSAIISSQDTVCVFNGSDAVTPDAPMKFGDVNEIVGGSTLYTRFGDSVYEHLMVFKRNEIWMVNGTNPDDYQRFKISDSGCCAPGTIINCNTGFEIAPGVKRQVVIWMSEKSINSFDGNSIDVISDDISNYFNRQKSECINTTYIDYAEAFFDELNCEYHWLFPSGSATSNNTELVYDLRRKKWYKIDRGTGKYLQVGMVAHDQFGGSYTYGGIDTGYIERLEYGTTFDGTNITSTFRTADLALGEWKETTKIRKCKHVMRSKSTSTANVTVSHYGDCNNTATTSSFTHSLNSSTYRVLQKIESMDWGNHNFHSINCTVTTSNESVGYEPIGLAIKYRSIHDELF